MEYKENFKLGVDDIDKECNITNKSILRIFENIAGYHSDTIGRGVMSKDEKGSTWILLEWKVKVLKRQRYGDIIKAKTWARSFKKYYTYRDFEIYNKSGEICVIGTSKWILLDLNKSKIAKFDENLIKNYGIVDKNVFNKEEIEKIKEPENYENEILYKINRKDIDFNGHVHNLNYLDLAYEALPENIYLENNFDNIRITYKKEIKLGETVKCKYGKEKDKHIVSIFSEDESIKHAIIELK